MISQIVLGGMGEVEAHLGSLVIKNYHLNVNVSSPEWWLD